MTKDGTVQYLIKWNDLSYAESHWENEDEDIPDFVEHVQNFEDLKVRQGKYDSTGYMQGCIKFLIPPPVGWGH